MRIDFERATIMAPGDPRFPARGLHRHQHVFEARLLGGRTHAVEQLKRRRDLRARQRHRPWCRRPSAGTSRIRGVCCCSSSSPVPPKHRVPYASGGGDAQIALVAGRLDLHDARMGETKCCSTADVRQSHRGTAWSPRRIRWPPQPARAFSPTAARRSMRRRPPQPRSMSSNPICPAWPAAATRPATSPPRSACVRSTS